jgi:hypothetical protein
MKKQAFTIYLQVRLRKRIQKLAIEYDISVSQLIERFITFFDKSNNFKDLILESEDWKLKDEER